MTPLVAIMIAFAFMAMAAWLTIETRDDDDE